VLGRHFAGLGVRGRGRIADAALEKALDNETAVGGKVVEWMEDIRRAQQMLDAAMKAALEADVAAG